MPFPQLPHSPCAVMDRILWHTVPKRRLAYDGYARENSTHDSGVWLLDRIMNQMNAGVYITDVDTDEILFMNSGMKKQFGLVEPEGKICWQVLQKGMSGRCPSAPCRVCCGTALPQHPLRWEEPNTRYQQRLHL